ncbi:MAG: penicillin-binding protein 2 [Pseudomonadota bacterium]
MGKTRKRRAANARRAQRAHPSYIGRRRTLAVVLTLMAVALVGGGYYQQIVRKDFLQDRANANYLSPVEVPAHRGVIRDRHGEVLAVSTPVDSVGVDPRLVGTDAERLAVMADALGQGVDEIRQRIASHSNKEFIYLARWLAPEKAQGVVDAAEAAGIEGVSLKREYRRYYPGSEVFSHVVGFAGSDDVGQEGLELHYDEHLRAVPGRKWVIRDARRRMLEDVEKIRAPKEGQDLRLTLDHRLQFITYKALKRAVGHHGARGGSAVLLDVLNGEILAAANQPGYNPNSDRSNKGGSHKNRALTDVYEPGSTLKPFTVAIGLELGTITPATRIDTGAGHFSIGANRVRDHRPLGTIDPATVLRKSSNVGAARIALDLPQEQYWKLLSDFGFGRAAGVGFPAEADGYLADYQRWANIDQATLSFGYGLSVSTLQLAQAYAILAADGILRRPSLLMGDQPADGQKVLSATVARTVRHMMEAVATSEGTAPRAAIDGYSVAGKTGTVKKLGPKGYEKKKYRSLFAGMAPASDPRLVLVVMVDEPRKKGYYGGVVAAPVFAEVMTAALRLLNVPPDRPQQLDEIQLAASGDMP